MEHTYRLIDRTLVVDLSYPRRIISSAVHGGGLVRASAIINHQVASAPPQELGQPGHQQRLADPSRYLGKLARQLGVAHRCVGLMTAVDMRQLVVTREKADGLWVEGFFTVGVTNAVHAGMPFHENPDGTPPFQTGTINIILVTNAGLSSAALIGAVGVATESKTATLIEKQVPACSGSGLATGTGTDALVIATGNGPRLRYSGTHTSIGSLIGQVVSRGVRTGLEKIS